MIVIFLCVILALFVLDELLSPCFLEHITAHDDCEICRGMRGGVPGNENIVGGRVVCDYCHVTAMREQIESDKQRMGKRAWDAQFMGGWDFR